NFDSCRSTASVVVLCAIAGIFDGRGGPCAHHGAVETRDPVRCTFQHLEFDVADAERDSAETFVGRVASDAISPGTDGLDEFLVLLEIEARPFEPFASSFEAANQRLAIWH